MASHNPQGTSSTVSSNENNSVTVRQCEDQVEILCDLIREEESAVKCFSFVDSTEVRLLCPKACNACSEFTSGPPFQPRSQMSSIPTHVSSNDIERSTSKILISVGVFLVGLGIGLAGALFLTSKGSKILKSKSKEEKDLESQVHNGRVLSPVNVQHLIKSGKEFSVTDITYTNGQKREVSITTFGASPPDSPYSLVEGIEKFPTNVSEDLQNNSNLNSDEIDTILGAMPEPPHGIQSPMMPALDTSLELFSSLSETSSNLDHESKTSAQTSAERNIECINVDKTTKKRKTQRTNDLISHIETCPGSTMTHVERYMNARPDKKNIDLNFNASVEKPSEPGEKKNEISPNTSNGSNLDAISSHKVDKTDLTVGKPDPNGPAHVHSVSLFRKQKDFVDTQIKNFLSGEFAGDLGTNRADKNVVPDHNENVLTLPDFSCSCPFVKQDVSKMVDDTNLDLLDALSDKLDFQKINENIPPLQGGLQASNTLSSKVKTSPSNNTTVIDAHFKGKSVDKTCNHAMSSYKPSSVTSKEYLEVVAKNFRFQEKDSHTMSVACSNMVSSLSSLTQYQSMSKENDEEFKNCTNKKNKKSMLLPVYCAEKNKVVMCQIPEDMTFEIDELGNDALFMSLERDTIMKENNSKEEKGLWNEEGPRSEEGPQIALGCSHDACLASLPSGEEFISVERVYENRVMHSRRV